jgi:hypothetical protein
MKGENMSTDRILTEQGMAKLADALFDRQARVKILTRDEIWGIIAAHCQASIPTGDIACICDSPDYDCPIHAAPHTQCKPNEWQVELAKVTGLGHEITPLEAADYIAELTNTIYDLRDKLRQNVAAAPPQDAPKIQTLEQLEEEGDDWKKEMAAPPQDTAMTEAAREIFKNWCRKKWTKVVRSESEGEKP